ncbi:hypothetical protein JXQ70_12005 [bacterium]|nr:hypothetical protein [bacterium]
MIKLEGSKKEFTLAARVARSVELVDIYLSNARVESFLREFEPQSRQFHLKISFPISKHAISSNNRLLVWSAISIAGTLARDDVNEIQNKEPIVFSITVEYTAEFDMPDDPIPDDIGEIGLQSFAKLNGIYLLMPYLRQAIHDEAIKMKINIPPLPTILLEQSDEKNEPTQLKKTKKRRPLRKKTDPRH